VKVAATALTASIVTVQPALPVHAPLQPVKVESPAAAGLKVTSVP
jgi:hypothetical protein